MFEPMSDGQRENMRARAHTHTHTHTHSLFSALPLKLICELGHVFSHKNDTKEKYISYNKAALLYVPKGF
jgi:hypothetical protein